MYQSKQNQKHLPSVQSAGQSRREMLLLRSVQLWRREYCPDPQPSTDEKHGPFGSTSIHILRQTSTNYKPDFTIRQKDNDVFVSQFHKYM